MAYGDDDKKYKRPVRYSRDDYRAKRSEYNKEEEAEIAHARRQQPEYKPERVREQTVVSQRLAARVDADSIKPLRLMSSAVIGGIFDRVIFLERRIEELRQSVELRKQIHRNIEVEIEDDIRDRANFIQTISDINERRNLKLDISVLRKERRNENVQFWRDLVELETELRKMEEEHEIEKKIAGIFANVERAEGAKVDGNE